MDGAPFQTASISSTPEHGSSIGGHSRSSETSSQPSSGSQTAASSTTSSTNSPQHTDPHTMNVRDQTQKFLGDLNNFIAVGTVRLHLKVEEALKPPERGRGTPAGEDPHQVQDYPQCELTTLVRAGWIRADYLGNEHHPDWTAVRVYVLPDDLGRRFVARSSAGARRALKIVMSRIDISPEAWDARFDPTTSVRSNIIPHGDEESLFYIFNTLNPPNPSSDGMSDPYAKKAIQDILADTAIVDGLKTPLYTYQRRSAAMMIQKETHPAMMLDPRYHTCRALDGQVYYYDKEEGNIVRDKRFYQEARGGILAETMGYGKTLICLAVILATRGHFPRIPSKYLHDIRPIRSQTGSLFDTVAAKIGNASIPWKVHFETLMNQGEHHTRCIEACENNVGSYNIPPPSPRPGSRKTPYGKAIQLRLCSANLIVVPPNLVEHWQQEIAKHTEGLKVLVINKGGKKAIPVPPADELLQYDIILFSKTRFEKESTDGGIANDKKQSAPEYHSPLKNLHWIRIIVDEGHGFASRGHRTNAMAILDDLRVERRWAVSGTPSNGLIGVEVGLAANETGFSTALSTSPLKKTSLALQALRSGVPLDQESEDLERLKLIIADFLKQQPWANSRADDSANWNKYIKPLDDEGKRSKATSIRITLQGLIVRHRIEDIDKDLPPLHNKIVSLKPSFYDKLSINLFVFVLISNAITSERTDQDYMFHPRNRKQLNLLINNLRQSGFWWVGFRELDVAEALRVSRIYIEENRHKMTEADLVLLNRGVDIGERTLDCGAWAAFTRYHEMGVFVDQFPDDAHDAWALCQSPAQALLLGTSTARLAQQHVDSRLLSIDPAEGLTGAGLRAMQAARKRAETEKATSSPQSKGGPSVNMEPKLKDKTTKPRPDIKSQPTSACGTIDASNLQCNVAPASLQARLIATASAKLTYLVDRVLALQDEEKIIIFYEGDNVAFWIADTLELVHVKFLIYSNELSTTRRAQYLASFEHTETFRVLIMDVKQAAHGLHVASASRVFIVNPIWQPNIESQAIKRAHRIGQKKTVFVETLVLEGTLEEKMMNRRKAMTNQELHRAEKSLLDDNTMAGIIQREKFLPISDEEFSGDGQMARLSKPQQFFGHAGLTNAVNNPDEGLISLDEVSSNLARRTKRRSSVDDDIPYLESDVLPRLSKRRKTLPLLKTSQSPPDEMVTDDGIIYTWTPSRRSSRHTTPRTPTTPRVPTIPQPLATPRSPPKMSVSFLLNRDWAGVNQGSGDNTACAPRKSLFGGSASPP